MRLSFNGYKAATVTLLAIAGLVVCLGFTVVRLFEVERSLRTDGMYTNIWLVTQTQFEAAILAESLARKAADANFSSPDQEPGFRADILISRLATLLEGPQGKFLEEINLAGDLKQSYVQLTLAEPYLHGQIDAQAAGLLREQMRDLAYKLRDAANKILVLGREQAAAKREGLLHVIFEGFAFLLGIVLSAAFLLIRLFKGV